MKFEKKNGFRYGNQAKITCFRAIYDRIVATKSSIVFKKRIWTNYAYRKDFIELRQMLLGCLDVRPRSLSPLEGGSPNLQRREIQSVYMFSQRLRVHAPSRRQRGVPTNPSNHVKLALPMLEKTKKKRQ